MHIVDTINFWARTAPHRAAVIQRNMVTSYKSLADGINSIGERIERLELDKRKPIAVSINNRMYMMATVFALLRDGFTVAPVGVRRHPFLPGAGIHDIIYDKEGLVVSSGRNIQFDRSWLPGPQWRSKPKYRKRPAENPDVVFFTSGTTGLPKKVVHSIEALNKRFCLPLAIGSGAYQKVMVLPNLTMTFGFCNVCEVLNFGKTVCFSPPHMALALVNLFNVEAIVAATAQALLLVDIKIKNPGYRVDSLKAIFVGAGKIQAESIARIRASLGRNVINYYGSTEAGVCVLSPFDVLGDASGGIPPPWVETEIVDEAGRQMPTGAEGIMRIRTPQLMEALKTAGSGELAGVRGGWFYPGDIASLDIDGAIRLAGRNSDVINRGGFKVSGTRIEEIILQTFPEVKEAAACGIHGRSGVEELWIALVLNRAVNIDQIKARLLEHKDVQLAPDEMIILDSLPRGELGKVQKPRLGEIMLGLKRGG